MFSISRSITRRWLTALMVLVMGCTISACGDDEEETVGQGAQQVAELKALVLDEHGQVFFDVTSTADIYQIGLESKEDAQSLVGLYAGSGFTGQAYTRKLDDNKGTVQVSIGNDGVFYQVRFAVEGIPPFKLNLIDEGGNAFGIIHQCDICGYTWKSTLPRCPRAGSKTYHP